jgi:hypothetical protein
MRRFVGEVPNGTEVACPHGATYQITWEELEPPNPLCLTHVKRTNPETIIRCRCEILVLVGPGDQLAEVWFEDPTN